MQDRRITTRLAHTWGPSRLRIKRACGRPVKALMTRSQRRTSTPLSLCKHLVKFILPEDLQSVEVMEVYDEQAEQDEEVEIHEEQHEEAEQETTNGNKFSELCKF